MLLKSVESLRMLGVKAVISLLRTKEIPARGCRQVRRGIAVPGLVLDTRSGRKHWNWLPGAATRVSRSKTTATYFINLHNEYPNVIFYCGGSTIKALLDS
jgi:hypothetical protein